LCQEVRAFTTNALGPQHQLKLLTQKGYLPGVPVLVRVEVRNASGPERDLWDASAVLSVNQAGVTLSTNRVTLRNGLGSALVAFRDGGDFNLTATVAGLQATRALVSLTNDVTVPAGASLTILPNTLVLFDGVTSGAVANDLFISGRIESLGTEDEP